MNLVVILVLVAVGAMATMFAIDQIRKLSHAARYAYQTKNWTMMFWACDAILTLTLALTIFLLSAFDMLDGKMNVLINSEK